ncbi:hypothetical protein GCM10007860_07150 [Chitiniphilus shinanonensis]|uniref:Copper chaperone PCu(A)C n=1 Tax=Chitiniphilus shinanonensis TaxID=553088 RepID=A0ABQ6BNH9_9NEIS|nr:copper chaperone PCu(A)C [Chitiniphilus shinanonensis]GLS03570.1 hypothetical protein GCM10007860_07150 [Chitiniphilus shinanonensis]
MKKLILGALLAVSASLAAAHEYQAGKLLIGHPWARATAPGATVAGVFLTLDNSGGDAADKLVAVATPAAERAELHSMSMDNGVMKMRPVPAIDVPAKARQALAPGGLHIMLTGLKQPLKEGASIPLTLTFEQAGPVQVQVKVEALGASAPAGPKH